MEYAYEVECNECGNQQSKLYESDEYMCDQCNEYTEHDEVNRLGRYRVVIAVNGTINNSSISGVTSRTVTAEDKQSAEHKAVSDFKEDPDYNTDISVNKIRFPDGEYLDNWSYNPHTARAVAVEPTDAETSRVKWTTYGHKV